MTGTEINFVKNRIEKHLQLEAIAENAILEGATGDSWKETYLRHNTSAHVLADLLKDLQELPAEVPVVPERTSILPISLRSPFYKRG